MSQDNWPPPPPVPPPPPPPPPAPPPHPPAPPVFGASGGWNSHLPPAPPASPAPRAPEPGSSQRNRVIAGAAVGVVMVLIVAVTAALALRDNHGGALPATTDASAPSLAPGRATTTPGGAATPTTAAASDLDSAIDQAMAFVEKTRGKKFKSRPPVTVLPDTAFVARFNQLLDKDYAEHKTDYDNTSAILQAFAVLPKGVGYLEAERQFGAAGVLGFYDPEANELTVRAGKVTPFVKIVLTHELTHALDDQYFELYRPQYDNAKDEIGFGFTAVAEGDARRVENAFRASLSSADQRSAAREEAGYSSNFSLGNLTVPFLELQVAPYTYGEAFINNLLKNGGEAAVDAALTAPPHTSEQVMDFAKYQAHEDRIPVSPPPADGPVLEDGVVGQIAIQSILEGSVSRSTAAAAAAGWGGDWFVAWRDGDVPCVRMRVVMDTTKDLVELKSAFDSWARGRAGAAVASTSTDLTLTSCAR